MNSTVSSAPGEYPAQKATDDERQKIVVKRHGVFTRFWHWINLICLVALLMSGLQIFNAHPALYWGSGSNFDHPLLMIGSMPGPDGNPQGITRIAGHDFVTTGVLGLSQEDGQPAQRAFPSWATLPGTQWLSLGREWHFTAAWLFAPLLFAYLIYSLVSGRRRRLIAPRGADVRGLPRTVIDHARFRFAPERRYNPLQKLTYLVVLFVLLPLMVLTGLAMSPTMDATWPWLPAVFGGHQSARTVHFICAFTLVAFFIIHLLLVIVSGVVNNLRSMITGGYRVESRTGETRHD